MQGGSQKLLLTTKQSIVSTNSIFSGPPCIRPPSFGNGSYPRECRNHIATETPLSKVSKGCEPYRIGVFLDESNRRENYVLASQIPPKWNQVKHYYYNQSTDYFTNVVLPNHYKGDRSSGIELD